MDIFDKKYISETRHKVNYSEVDPYGIVHHSFYVLWAELGLRDYLYNQGVSLDYDIENISGKYISPAKDNDNLSIKTRLKNYQEHKLTVMIEISSETAQCFKGEIKVRI